MYKNKAYIIRTKTNLHVGSDGTNFGIVDKEVQRDTISNLPVIHASSLKGAIRDHFDSMIKESETSQHFVKLFGDGDNQGLIKFIDAKLLFLPLRSNKKPFYHTTSISNLKAMQEFLIDMGIKIEIDELITNDKSVVIGTQGAFVEDVECESLNIDISKIKKLFCIENMAIFNDEDFNEVVLNLPVIARNSLEGSGNLWYEEVVPRESIFYTVLNYYNNFNEKGADRRGRTDKNTFDTQIQKFDDKLLSEHVQIGANASIGYGICSFLKIGANDE